MAGAGNLVQTEAGVGIIAVGSTERERGNYFALSNNRDNGYVDTFNRLPGIAPRRRSFPLIDRRRCGGLFDQITVVDGGATQAYSPVFKPGRSTISMRVPLGPRMKKKLAPGPFGRVRGRGWLVI